METAKVAILGAGSWGTALGYLLSRPQRITRLWARRTELAKGINSYRENRRYLPGILLPSQVRATAELEEVLQDAKIIVLAVPTIALREVAHLVREQVGNAVIIISTCKGLEPGTFKRPSEILAEELPPLFADRIVSLSGPSHAEETARDIPTTVVVSATLRAVAEQAQDILMRPAFRVYTNPDLVGVELAGAVKNVIAIACGVAEGLGFGDNTKAALITRGLAEISRLGVAMGANQATFAGLAGLGDLVVTCTSKHSRNMRFGILLGKGKPVKEALEAIGQTVEGFRTTEAVYELARQQGVEMPITRECYNLMYGGHPAAEAVAKLMGRLKTHELEEGVADWR
ncbi:MAG: NAD(P)H-dependent glycerol-3-phosphate dehydrogenase [Heliobacteriaceae bacterium]|nr:NAD(P)H-dependent glycerol-3-phosphate dehydrogenase [Heliobacteriaceae bacterium]